MKLCFLYIFFSIPLILPSSSTEYFCLFYFSWFAHSVFSENKKEKCSCCCLCPRLLYELAHPLILDYTTAKPPP